MSSRRLLHSWCDISARLTCVRRTSHKSKLEENNVNPASMNSSTNEFRVLLTKPTTTQARSQRSRKRRVIVERYKSMPVDQDWTQVWPTRGVFKASAVPLPLRQGMVTSMMENKGIPPCKYGNAELMKIPNFLHLTPKHIYQHCNAIKVFCTTFPNELKDSNTQKTYFPLQITTSDYLESACNIRDERARIVELKVNIASLSLNEVSADKLRRLAGNDRFCSETGDITIKTDRCPRRYQNIDYAYYLLTALYLECQVREDWENEKHYTDWEQYNWALSSSREKFDFMTNLQPLDPASQRDNNLQELKEEYSQSVSRLHDKENGESLSNLQAYGKAVERLYGLNN